MFRSDGGNNLLCEGTLIPDTNINLFTKDEFQERFFADIMKDSQTDIKVDKIREWLTNCYPGNGNIPPANYKNSLHTLEEKVNIPVIKNNITELKNILKTSTVGSNTKISLANNVFWESGFGSKDIIARKDYTTFLTPAAKLDPLSKEKADEYWPETDDYTIGFDESFTGRLGFPHTVWRMPHTNKVQITYNTDDKEAIDYDVIKDEEPVGKYLAGNNKKNDAINRLKKYTDCSDFIKYVETKELGDVAQVWNYLAFVAINAINNGDIFKEMREKSVMITTDSVVLLFCILLHLSCVYTGSREGVESGHCTLKHYLAGDVNYDLKLETMIDNHYNRIKSQLAATKIGLQIMKRDKSKFWYYRYNRREQIAKTSGDFLFPKDDSDGKISQIDELFQAVIDNIDDRLGDAEGVYNAANKNAVNDGEIDSKFTAFCVAINRFKYSQLLTRLNTSSYVLHPQHPSQLLERYASIIDPDIRIPNLDEVKDAALKDNINIEQGGGRDLVSIGGGYDGDGDLSLDAEIYYYDFFLLTYIEFNFFQRNAEANESLKDIFPVYYDYKVSQIDENTNLFSFFGDTELRFFLTNISDHSIINRGRMLSTLINFAEDVDVEISDLETYLHLEDVKDDSEEDEVHDNSDENNSLVVSTAKGNIDSDMPVEGNDKNSASSEEEVEMRGTDNTGYNTGMVVASSSSSATEKGHATSESPFEAESYLSQQTTEKSSNTFPTPQTVTADFQGITYNPESVMTTKVGTSVSTDINNEGMEETGGRKPGRHKSKKNKNKISIKNKSKKNIKKKRTIKNKRTIKKKITKRHKKTRKHN
jgi:hypothetical protein